MALTANAGSDISAFVGEFVNLDGTASTDDTRLAQADGSWSIRWQTGDGYDVQDIVKAPHAYLAAGVYTATLTVKDTLGNSEVDTVQVTVSDLPTATVGNTQTLVDTGDPATNRTNLQNAINTAAANSATNRIVVPAGFEAYAPLYLPARTATNYVTVEVANASSNLPALTRATLSDEPDMWRLIARDQSATGHYMAVSVSRDTSYFRFVGMLIQRETTGGDISDVFGTDFGEGTEGAQPHHIIVDRCVIDGNGTQTRRGFAPNGRYWSFINGSILDIKALGTESKAIGMWSGEGPLVVINNRLDAASINFLIGGIGTSSDEQILKGLVFRGNYSWKDPAWIGPGGDNDGIGYAIKNNWELKWGHNVVAAGNVFENNWQDGQVGEAILIKSTNEDATAGDFGEVKNVDFRDNKTLNVRMGFSVNGLQNYATVAPFSTEANHIKFRNNLFTTRGGRGNLIGGPNQFEYIHNTMISTEPSGWLPAGNFVLDYAADDVDGASDDQAEQMVMRDNIGFRQTEYSWAFSGDLGSGNGALAVYAPDAIILGNVFPGVSSGLNPTGNFYPSSTGFNDNFTNFAGGDYSLAPTSAYKNAAADGTDIGADMGQLDAATAGALSGVWTVTTGGSYTLSANSGTYSYEGSETGLTESGSAAYSITANAGAYSYQGGDVVLTQGAPGSYTLTALPGSYSYSGGVAGLRRAIRMLAETGTFSYSGGVVVLGYSRGMVAESGEFSYTGHAAGLVKGGGSPGDYGSGPGEPIKPVSTNIVRNVSDRPTLSLRVLLDEVSGATGAATDDYALHYSHNLGLYAPVGTGVVLGHASAYVAEGDPTSNLITAVGFGTFQPGKISEDGEVDDLHIAADALTELRFDIEFVAALLAQGDTVDFKVLRNGVELSDYYPVIPSVTIAKNLGNYILAAEAGEFLYQGGDVSLPHPYRLIAEPGVYVYDGSDVIFAYEPILIPTGPLFVRLGNGQVSVRLGSGETNLSIDPHDTAVWGEEGVRVLIPVNDYKVIKG
jgi:PKD repeat protein